MAHPMFAGRRFEKALARTAEVEAQLARPSAGQGCPGAAAAPP